MTHTILYLFRKTLNTFSWAVEQQCSVKRGLNKKKLICLLTYLLTYIFYGCSLHSRPRSSRLPRPSSDIPWHVQLAGVHHALLLRSETSFRHSSASNLSIRTVSALSRTPCSGLHHGREISLSAGIRVCTKISVILYQRYISLINIMIFSWENIVTFMTFMIFSACEEYLACFDFEIQTGRR